MLCRPATAHTVPLATTTVESAGHADSLPFSELLDRHAFDAPGLGLGHLALELADAYLDPGPRPRNGSTLSHLVLFPERSLDHPGYEGLTAEGLERALARIEAARRRPHHETGPGEPAPDRRELEWVSRVLTWSCRLGLARLTQPAELATAALRNQTRRELRRQLEPLVEDFRSLWLERNRPGGLVDSEARLRGSLPESG